MSIKTSVLVLCKAIQKERLFERTHYLLDHAIQITSRKLAQLRIAYNKYERKGITRHGLREDHPYYEGYIKIIERCPVYKEEFIKMLEMFEEFKQDILESNETGILHIDRAKNLYVIGDHIAELMDNITKTFTDWSIFYSSRMLRIHTRMKFLVDRYNDAFPRRAREVPYYEQLPDSHNRTDYIFRMEKGQNYPSFLQGTIPNDNTNMVLRGIQKSKRNKARNKTRSANSAKRSLNDSPVAVPMTVATRKMNKSYAPIAFYYKNSPVEGRVSSAKTKERLQKILELWTEYTKELHAFIPVLQEAKQAVPSNQKKVYSRRNNMVTSVPKGATLVRSIDAVIVRIGEFKKLVQEQQRSVQEMEVNDKSFDQVIGVLGKPKRGYMDLKRNLENLLEKLNKEVSEPLKEKLNTLGKELDYALKKQMDGRDVDTHFSQIHFEST
jgi:hypothetical protein